MRRWFDLQRWRYGIAALTACLGLGTLPAWYCGRDAGGWYDGDPELQLGLARTLVDFEQGDAQAFERRSKDRFVGEWALVTHQMTALGLAQLCLTHPEWKEQLLPAIGRAATMSFRPEMRDFGTEAWGEDALATLASSHGHAYLAYSALAVGMARVVGAPLSPTLIAQHDALIAAYERRLLASPTGLIETYPHEAYPTDVAAVAGAIAVHGRATHEDHGKVLEQWARLVRSRQLDATSGLVIQRMGATDGAPHDAPRGSGTGLAAYFAGFADRQLAQELSSATLAHERSWLGFSGIREYAEGHTGTGDIDSGPVVLGVSVSATGFALALARAHRERDTFVRLYRTTELFGLSNWRDDRLHFATGGPIGNALLLAFLTSGPEIAP
ncbi:MAG TPA: hypothetical protein VLC09_07230 [Polyangiaceae bacterium]|nr:hypothetical protein [Polyangiaceae bacterium]